MPQINYKQYLDNRYGPNINRIFRILEKLHKKLSHTENSITFLCKCRLYGLVPKGLQLRASYNSARCYHILKRASEAMVRERIQFHRYTKVNLLKDIDQHLRYISNEDLVDDYNRMYNSILYSYNTEFKKQKNTHLKKFRILLTSRQNTELQNLNNNPLVDKTIINSIFHKFTL